MPKIVIYKIECLPNGKVYVGQSSSHRKRWGEHRRTLRLGEHHNILLQRAWIKYGERNFKFSVIEEVTESTSDTREVYWIDFYGSNKPKSGYNLDGGGNKNKTHHELTKMKISEIAKSQRRALARREPSAFQCENDGCRERRTKEVFGQVLGESRKQKKV